MANIVKHHKENTLASGAPQDRFRHHWERFAGLSRKTVEAFWNAGRALREVKESIPFGEFMLWYRAEGLSPSTVSRLLRVAEIENCQIGNFATISAALAGYLTPPKERKRKVLPDETGAWLQSVLDAARDIPVGLKHMNELDADEWQTLIKHLPTLKAAVLKLDGEIQKHERAAAKLMVE